MRTTKKTIPMDAAMQVAALVDESPETLRSVQVTAGPVPQATVTARHVTRWDRRLAHLRLWNVLHGRR